MRLETTPWRPLALTIAALALSAVAAVQTAGPAVAAAPVGVPAGMDAGIAVYDRATGRFTHRAQATKPFRSASLVKLLIALDLTWAPAGPLTVADRARLDLMLRGSDDAAATEFWTRNGEGAIVERMASRLGLRHTTPPPDGYGWGSTGVSAEDLVRVYRYVLDTAPAGVRELIMGNLSAATTCAVDGFDQSFGIRSAFTGPTAVKQGWTLFGSAPRNPCVPAASARAAASTPAREIDYSSGALHTTGTVGARHRVIVVALSTHRPGTSFAQAGYALTNVVRRLPVPGARLAPPPRQPERGIFFGTWDSEVGVYAAPTLSSARVGTVPSYQEVRVACQLRGELVEQYGLSNDWWTYLPELGGYMPNIFFDWADNELPADVVPLCG
ncbi:hypothetical protein [Catenuloplanes atrovinosus]|uniref:Uncharacterized protein n=1 Tax=Catenuloplanes atrovinosus TaxID=137266 RepID=A0AAE3YRA3_9ACTN|nr:hypothetical protein [Catenuloplanes atrovinosus]MDR7277201.1 hypothetical protein [Catenuloplanes atrovinosus]